MRKSSTTSVSLRSNTHTLLRIILLAICVLAVTTANAGAQSSTGSLVGRVTDASGALISGAQVTITDTATDGALVVKTDDSGLYGISALQPGSYIVQVAKEGFEDTRVTSVKVDIATTSSVNVQLKIGSSKISVDVVAQAQLINSDTPVFSTDIPKEVIQDLPFSERSALTAVMLAPGVQGDPQYNMGIQSENAPIFTQPTTPGGSLSVGGGRPGSALQLVDGVDLAMVGYPRVAITFSGDDLQQISVQSTAIAARYGRSGGGVINQASRGGTLIYHGKLGFRHEDPFFEATTYGQGTFTFTTPNGPVIKPVTQDVHQNLFTAAFGGPIPVRWHEINKKTFFFVSFEPLRAGSKVFSRQRIPTPAELSGDFSNAYSLLNTTVLSTQGYAAAVAAPRLGNLSYQFPLNAAGFPTGARYNSSTSYVAVPGNNLSAQLKQNQLATFLLSQFPTPTDLKGLQSTLNFINADASYANDGNNIVGARGVQNTDNRYNIRIDQNIGHSDHAFVRYTRVPTNGVRFSWMGPSSLLNNQPTQVVDSWNILGDYTHIFRNSWVNDSRFSYTKMNYTVKPADVTTTQDYAAKYGLTPAAIGSGIPSFGIDTGSYGSSTGGNDGGISNNAVYHFGDDVFLVKGSHAVSFGGEFRAMQLDRLPNAGIFGGTYGFAAGSTNNGSAGGNATASFILGSINAATLSTVQFFDYRWKYTGLYVMDDWKIAPKLTLNLGLRYHLEFPRTETNGLQGSFLPNVSGTLNGVAATGAFAFSGTNGLPKTLWPVNYKAFEPRLGFAYLARPNMTIRGSFNIIHAPLTGLTNSNIPALTPNALNIGGANGGTNPAAWVNYITNPVSLGSGGIPGVLKPPSEFYSYGNGLLPAVSQSNSIPYVENWSLSTQYQFSPNIMVQAAYVGARSHHLFSSPEDTNVIPYNTLLSEIASNFNFSSSSTTNKYGLGTGNANINALPYPQFYNNSIQSIFVREGSADYDGLYVNGTARMKGGVTLISSFTWAKSIDDGSTGSVDGIVTDIFGFTYTQSPFTKAGERSVSTYDIPTHITAGYTWNIPVGARQAFNSNKIVNAIFGNLRTSGIFNAQSGYPFSPILGSTGYFCSNSLSGTTVKYCGNGNGISTGSGHYQLRPSIVPGVPLLKDDWKHHDPYNLGGSGGFVNQAAFVVPGAPGNATTPNTPAFGNSPRTLPNARSPRTIYFDMSASKDIPIRGDRVMLQLKADAINVFNHTNFFINPNSGHNFTTAINSSTGLPTFNTAGFGTLGSGNNSPGRTFALGAALTF